MVTIELAVNRIRYFYRTNHRIPTYGEMMKLFHYRSKSPVTNLVKKLIDEGILEKDSNGKLIPKNLPLTLPQFGVIKAGIPQEAAESIVEQMSLDTYLIRNPDHSFVLTVSGDSMIDAGLHDGDRVIVDRDIEPQNYDIVAAIVDNEWTLKYFVKEDEKVTLVPANPKYKLIEPKQSLTIGGVVVSSVRKYH